MAVSQSIVLVTGGNGGIGFEVVTQLLSDASKHVLLGSRSVEKGAAAVKDLESRKQPGTMELLQLDVSSEDSIAAAATSVESKHGRLDVLVNNAAIAFADGGIAKAMAQCYQTNVTGTLLMVDYFAPLLKKAHGVPRIVNVSSGVGLVANYLDPKSTQRQFQIRGTHYRASKAAMNMVTAEQIVEFEDEGFKVFAYCPGFSVSNLGPFNKADNGAQPTSQAAAPMVKIINGARDAEHGKFLHGTGQYDW